MTTESPFIGSQQVMNEFINLKQNLQTILKWKLTMEAKMTIKYDGVMLTKGFKYCL